MKVDIQTAIWHYQQAALKGDKRAQARFDALKKSSVTSTFEATPFSLTPGR